MAFDTTEAYEYQPSFILGFHGCDRRIGEEIIAGRLSDLRPSESEYDWLGHGIYFWEGNLMRALRWAQGVISKDESKSRLSSGPSSTCGIASTSSMLARLPLFAEHTKACA